LFGFMRFLHLESFLRDKANFLKCGEQKQTHPQTHFQTHGESECHSAILRFYVREFADRRLPKTDFVQRSYDAVNSR